MTKNRIFSLLPLIALAACDTGDATAPVLSDTEAYMDREVLIGVSGTDEVKISELAADHGVFTMETIDQIGVARLELPDEGQVREYAELLGEDHRVEFAEPNYLVRASATPNDPYAAYQWHMQVINAWDAWDTTKGGGVVVAVLDTGVSVGSDGFKNIQTGYDFYYNDSNPSDNVGHGSHVAGTIAQNSDNGVGVTGVAPNVEIMPVKVLSDNGYGDVSAIVNGLVYAADNGADVANLSLGTSYGSSSLQSAVQYAYNKGVVLVAATGNEYANSLSYPAAYSEVIAVGASRYDGTRSAYSNRGSGMELLAPGGDLSKDQNGDGYADGILQEAKEYGRWTYPFWEGTSMASPHVAGAAALLIAAGADSIDEVRTALAATASKSDSYDTTSGYGVIDIQAALDYVAGGSGGGTGSGTDTGAGLDTGSGSDSGSDSGSSADTTAPTISNVSGYTQGRRFTIEWTTNEPADSYVNFEDYGTYGDATLTTSHSLTFTGSRGSTYYFTLSSADAAGNETTTSTYYMSI